MRQTPTRTSRITTWTTHIPGRGPATLAYAPMPTDQRGFGDTAVIATIAGVDGEGADLWKWAASNHSNANSDALARWLICQGWAARLTASPSRLDLPAVEWHADIEQTVKLDGTGYGHETLAIGRLTFTSSDDTARAKGLLATARTLTTV